MLANRFFPNPRIQTVPKHESRSEKPALGGGAFPQKPTRAPQPVARAGGILCEFQPDQAPQMRPIAKTWQPICLAARPGPERPRREARGRWSGPSLSKPQSTSKSLKQNSRVCNDSRTFRLILFQALTPFRVFLQVFPTLGVWQCLAPFEAYGMVKTIPTLPGLPSRLA
jgi:hypothetical protein